MNWAPATARIMSHEWLLQVSMLPEVATTDGAPAEESREPGLTPGATQSPGCDATAASFSWAGLLEPGVETRIQITVYNEGYVMHQSSSPSVRFVIQHDGSSCWGDVLLAPSRIWEGKYGYFEEVQVPVRREGGEWKGSITIIPCPSIRCIHVCMLPNINTPFFGVSIARMAREDQAGKSILSEQGLLKAESLHSAAWEEMVTRSATDPYYKYGLYAARSLAVTHPEIYLQADALFLDHIGTNSGFTAAFAETDPHSASYSPHTFFSGRPFSFDLIDLDAYQTITNSERYPSEVAAFRFLDQRLLSLASCLKDKDQEITTLEKASILYFKLREQSRERPFIVYCADEAAYVATVRARGRVLHSNTGICWNMPDLGPPRAHLEIDLHSCSSLT